MQAIETDRSPGLPSLIVTTRRRFMPHGTSCSFLQAVTQALHSSHDLASLCRPDLTQGDFGFLHVGDRIEAVGGENVDALTEHDRISCLRILAALVDTL